MKQVLLVTLALLTLTAGPAAAQQFFDFNGQALWPAAVGGDLEMYSIVLDAAPATPPLPLDWANFEYTIVITGLTWDTDGTFTDVYSGGTITLYEDDSTAADYGNTATFVDGTVLLVGTVTTLSRTVFFVSTGVGSFSGNVDWTGGSEIDQIHPSDRLGWALLGSVSGGATVEPGYDEHWDGKVEPTTPIVGVDQASFGKVKSAF